MPLVRVSHRGPFVRPALVVAFDGWVNAGQAATEAARTIMGEGEVVASFDSDSLYDYRASRPTIDFQQGVMSRVTWPETSLRRRRLSGRDVLVLSGIEPNWSWQRLAREVAELAVELGVVEHVSLGGIPWATPHTRPVTTIVTASSPERLPPGAEHPEGLLRVPGSAVSIVEHAVVGAGIPALGFWARVPHYVGTTFHAGALALVERVSLALEVEVAVEGLAERAVEQRLELDAIAEARPDVRSMIEQLEALADQEGAVSGEQIAAEIERFLRERGSGEEGLDR